ncbi:MAG: sulfotransferase [Gammaproteobacteria bacterium]
MDNAPKFVCIGAQRAGSTWLYENLKAHAGIWLPPIKELHYFDQLRTEPFFCARYKSQLRTRVNKTRSLLRRGRWSLADFLWDIKFFSAPRSDRWYTSLFAQGRRLAAGDFTPAYATLSADAIAAVKRINPGIRVIFLMRDPIDRSWSQARKDLPRVHGKPLQEIPAQDVIRWFNERWCMTRSDYLTTLDNWFAHFPRDQFFLGFHEEITARPKDLLLRMYEFLGVEVSDRHVPRTRTQRINAEPQIDLPPEYEYELARIHEPLLARLKEMVSPYPRQWHERCVRVLNRGHGAVI